MENCQEDGLDFFEWLAFCKRSASLEDGQAEEMGVCELEEEGSEYVQLTFFCDAELAF